MDYKALLKKHMKTEFLGQHWIDVGRYKIQVLAEDQQREALSRLQLEVMEELVETLQPEVDELAEWHNDAKKQEDFDAEDEKNVIKIKEYTALMKLLIQCFETRNKLLETVEDLETEETEEPKIKLDL